MSIRLLQSIFIAGVLSPVDGSTLSLSAALEADLVNQGKAVWVAAPELTASELAHASAHARMRQPNGVPIILAQSAVPMILQSSGTMGANGSLTGLTALPYSVFPQPCFMYFPAGKVFSGSPAGMYFASILTTTTATVYNNMYTSGRPQDAVPTVPTPVVDAGPGAYTQTTGADIQIAAITLPGGTLSPSGAVRMTQTLTTSAGTATNRTIKSKFGSLVPMTWLISAATKSSTHASQIISNKNSVASQVCPDTFGGYAGSASQYSAINTAADVTLSYSASLTTADANQILEFLMIEVLP